MCFLFDISSMRYTIAIISNLPAIILMIRNIFDIIFMSKEVIPMVSPVVVTAETDSKSESRRFF